MDNVNTPETKLALQYIADRSRFKSIKSDFYSGERLDLELEKFDKKRGITDHDKWNFYEALKKSYKNSTKEHDCKAYEGAMRLFCEDLGI